MDQQIPPLVKELPIKSAGRGRIGRLLVEMGKLDPEDSKRVLMLQDESGLHFGEVATQLGLVTEADVQQALALQFGYPYLQPGRANYPPELVAAYQPFSDQVETLRAIRSQLLLHWFARENKALVVFSVDSGEGASFFAANLAVLFAQLDRQTLLIDANLRRPRQHEIFNLKNKQGLSEILAGRSSESSIAEVEFFPNLAVLPSGPLPPNPQELVTRSTFRDWTESLTRRFSIILIDVAAFSTSADALSIAASVGGALLVTRKHVTRMADIAAVGAQLSRAGVQLVGSVVVEF